MTTNRLTKNWFEIRYGISPVEVRRMFAVQKGLCPICKSEMNLEDGVSEHRAVVDHDGKYRQHHVRHGHCSDRKRCVRGLICYKCNVGLGMFGAKVDSLVNAVIYLRAYEDKMEKETKL